MSRQLGGLLAKQVGDTFEPALEIRCRQHGIGFQKIPNGCRRAYIRGRLTLIPCRTPFDFIICKDFRSATIDCKTIVGNTFTYSMCDPRQVTTLSEMGEHIPSGYVVWFRESDRIVFFSHIILRALQQRGSLSDTSGLYLGQIDSFNPTKILNLPVKSETQVLIDIK